MWHEEIVLQEYGIQVELPWNQIQLNLQDVAPFTDYTVEPPTWTSDSSMS